MARYGRHDMVPAMSGSPPSPMEDTNGAADAEFAETLARLRARRPLRRPEFRDARRALDANRPDRAEQLLRSFLDRRGSDIDALNLLAEAMLRRGRRSEAVALLERCLACDPGFDLARYNRALALHGCNRPVAALNEVERLLAKEPRNPLYRDLQALALTASGNHDAALACRRATADDYPGSPGVLVSYAQTLRTCGLREECVATFRKAAGIAPTLGAAWWGLASLRNYRFADDDIAQMNAALARDGLSPENRVQLLFALGKAHGDLGHYAQSFEAYARGNALRRLRADYDPDATTALVRRLRNLCTPEFFRARKGWGAGAAGPIFVVGMQRAGSTLVEQILASHPAVEGAGELPTLRLLARRLEETIGRENGTDYPDVLAGLDAGVLRALGEDYLAESRPRRPLQRSFFVDKEPFNFLHVAFIRLTLPGARIVDMRRHPLACCFSNFTSLFLHGLAHTARLSDLGRFYADYVALMTHFDHVLPGRVYRIFYESLVTDPEGEIRRLLAWLDLPFDERCLAFHRNPRPLNSASSEQVREPIFREALEHWRHYEPWLAPLKGALGPVLDAYPGVPPSVAP